MKNLPKLVWYVAYGSNLCRSRLQKYLDRGRDHTPPRADRALTIPNEMFFAGESTVWTGGRAYVDHTPRPDVKTLARAWLLTRRQWSDVLAMESGRPADDGIDPRCVAAGGHHAIAAGRYDTLVGLGDHEGEAVLTITGPEALDRRTCTRPAPAYLATIAAGLGEAHGLGPTEATRYLLERPGVAGHWDETELLEAVGAGPAGG